MSSDSNRHNSNHFKSNRLVDPADLLQNLCVILVNTSLPANIGSTARAMHTMGLSHLILVDPKRPPVDQDSLAHAKGGLAVLQNATIVSTLEDALQDCQISLAASSRVRHLPRPVLTPAQSASLIFNFLTQTSLPDCCSESNFPSNYSPKIALVFGREDRGLTNDELALTDYHIQIHANPAYPVLNLAAAVQVIGSFIYDYVWQKLNPSFDCSVHTHSHDNSTKQIDLVIRQHWDEAAITHAQAQKLNAKIFDLMLRLGLANAEQPNNLPKRLSRLTSRLQLDQKEYQLISAILNKIDAL